MGRLVGLPDRGDGVSGGRERVGWGLVGCGWLGRDFAAPAILASANGRLVAACDPDPAATASVASLAVGTKSVATVEELLETPGVDAVYVATPNHAHAGPTVAAARAGKHVLCEKPTARTADEAAEMIAACDAAGVLFATAYDQRWHAAHVALRRMIAAGELGTVTLVRIRYACWTGRDWSPGGEGAGGRAQAAGKGDHHGSADPHCHLPPATRHLSPYDNWRVDPHRAGGGAMIDLAPHGLDLAQALLGERVEDVRCLMQRRIHADVPTDDGAVIVGRTGGGALVDLSVGYNCPEAYPRRRLEVVGTLGLAVAEDTMGQTPGGRLTVTSPQGPDGAGPVRAVDFTGGDVPDRSPFLNQVEAFAGAVLGRRDWPYPASGDLHTMRLLDRCAADGATGVARALGGATT